MNAFYPFTNSANPRPSRWRGGLAISKNSLGLVLAIAVSVPVWDAPLLLVGMKEPEVENGSWSTRQNHAPTIPMTKITGFVQAIYALGADCTFCCFCMGGLGGGGVGGGGFSGLG